MMAVQQAGEGRANIRCTRLRRNLRPAPLDGWGRTLHGRATDSGRRPANSRWVSQAAFPAEP